MQLLAPDDLVVLVALARNEDYIARLSQHNGRADCLRAVGDAQRLRLRLDARHHLVEDLLGILGARIIRRENSNIGLARGYRSHLGALRGVAVAAATAHYDESLLGGTDVVDGVDHVLQRIGRVGIIDNGGKPRLRSQRFEATAHRVQGTHRAEHLVATRTQLHRNAIDAGQIVGIKAAYHPYPQLPFVQAQQHTVEEHLQHLAVVGGHLSQRVCRHAGAAVLHHDLAIAIVGVHDGKGPLRQAVEEQLLGADILLEGAVIVQMVVREVREARTAELQPSHAILHERVRRDLHKAVLAAAIDHLAQHSLQTQGVGCGVG